MTPARHKKVRVVMFEVDNNCSVFAHPDDSCEISFGSSGLPHFLKFEVEKISTWLLLHKICGMLPVLYPRLHGLGPRVTKEFGPIFWNC